MMVIYAICVKFCVYNVAPVTAFQTRSERVGSFQFAAVNAEIVDGIGTAKVINQHSGDIEVGIRGDSNNDGSVSIADIGTTVRVILGRQRPPVPVLPIRSFGCKW